VTIRVPALVLLALGAAACGGGGDEQEDADGPIACHTASRGSVTLPIDEERAVELAPGRPVTHEHGRLVWHAEHVVDAGEGESLVVRVESQDGALVTSSLLQLDGRPANDFRGGHGFTGLQYAYDAGGAELQWWCTAG
jgi:hypothetical protein